MYLLYNLALTFFLPFWLPWMWRRAKKRGEQPNWRERFGRIAIPGKGPKKRVWFHAVSVGEVVAARPILRELRKQKPDLDIVLSVTTSSGHQTARENDEGLYDHLIYFPLDIPRFVWGALMRVKPDVVALMETELWFNFLFFSKAIGAKNLQINGRISDRSFPRYQKLSWFMKSMLAKVDQNLMQGEKDKLRIEALGAKRALVLGNCKFDEAAQAVSPQVEKWREELGLSAGKPCIVVGSLRHEEFSLFASAIAPILDQAEWIIAPRHIEKVAELDTAFGQNFARRSRGEKITNGVLILDTYGELSAVYAVADIAIVGGGFADLGGQNIIQPLAAGKAVVHGPYMQNFKDVTEMARDQQCAVQSEATAESMRAAIENLIKDPTLRQKMGQLATRLVAANVGASARYAKAIIDAL